MQIKVGVIGLGYWGPNYVRNFIRYDQTEVVWACDLYEQSLKEISKLYPHLKLTKDYTDILKDRTINCVAIATPPDTHFEIAKAALQSNVHVLVAKPLATSSIKAIQLVNLAKKKKLILYGDLTYLYTGAVRVIRYLIKKRVIGSPIYYDSTRTNLGLLQKDVNVIWDLASHDFAIIDYLFDLKPQKVFAIASKHHKNSQTEEMAHITINYSNDFIAHIHVSWLSPVKLRTVLIGGDKKMIFFDDLQPDEKVKVYDKGVSFPSESLTPFKPIYRSGNIITPKIIQEEALFLEVADIVDQIRKEKLDYSNADLNVKIIKLLEACDESLRKNRPVNL